MKKISGIMCLLVFSILSCNGYDDSEIWDYVKNVNARLTALEEKCKEMNTNISSLQTLIGALETGDYITNVAPIDKDGKTIGYTITFKKSSPITIYNGTDGINGTNGSNGTNGEDGYVPVISVKKDADGLYYWTVDGNWLLDDDGNKVRASAIDGQNGINGTNGTNGSNGITPQLKIQNDYWYVSYDSGATWQTLGKAIGPKGDEGDSLFNSVEIGTNEVIFYLSNGSSFSIPLNHATNGEYESVDLELPSGTLWATCNVGANSPEEYGSYFAWAETKPKDVYSARFYMFGDGTEKGVIKYIVKNGDGKKELEPKDDAATANWGKDWQMPSRTQFEELLNSNYTNTTITTQNGVDGMLIVSRKNANSIFLPAAGCSYVGDNREYNESGTIKYWSRTVREEYPHEAYALRDMNVTDNWRYYGLSVRPVRKK